MPRSARETACALRASARTTLFCTVALVAPAHADAQLQVGFKVGPVFSRISSDAVNVTEGYLTAFGGGLYAIIPTPHFQLVPEVMLITKGADLEPFGIREDRELKIQYAEASLFVRLQTVTGRFTSFIMAGPSFGFEYDCDVEVDVEDDDEHFECDEYDDTILNNLKGNDIGVTGAVGTGYPIGSGKVWLEGRYTYGLSSISSGSFNARVNNRAFAIYAGYSLPVRF